MQLATLGMPQGWLCGNMFLYFRCMFLYYRKGPSRALVDGADAMHGDVAQRIITQPPHGLALRLLK
jgi:hypothetical protein